MTDAEPQPVATGELLPPIRDSAGLPSRDGNEHLDFTAALLDDIFCIPGTGVRFGLDAIIGWVPGIGDTIAALASLLIVFAGWRRRAARVTLARMVVNVVLETGIGMIPIIGDVSHVASKANRPTTIF